MPESISGTNASKPAFSALPIPVDGENVVYTFQNTLKIIGQGGQNTYFAKTKFHVTVIGGEVKSYIDMEEITCS